MWESMSACMWVCLYECVWKWVSVCVCESECVCLWTYPVVRFKDPSSLWKVLEHLKSVAHGNEEKTEWKCFNGLFLAIGTWNKGSPLSLPRHTIFCLRVPQNVTEVTWNSNMKQKWGGGDCLEHSPKRQSQVNFLLGFWVNHVTFHLELLGYEQPMQLFTKGLWRASTQLCACKLKPPPWWAAVPTINPSCLFGTHCEMYSRSRVKLQMDQGTVWVQAKHEHPGQCCPAFPAEATALRTSTLGATHFITVRLHGLTLWASWDLTIPVQAHWVQV